MRTLSRPSLTWCLFAVLLAGGCGPAELPPEPTPAAPTSSVEQGACDPYAQYCDYCGDWSCGAEEDIYNCPNDCGWCGDSVCNYPTEDGANCAADCSCGNGVCEAEAGERCDTCPSDCGFCDTYCARPVITRSAIWDIREGGDFPFNGPEGYPYFTAANGKKTGDVARRLDSTYFDNNVYASNFQGPVRVVDGGRPQWEWTADGSVQTSHRQYPAEWARRCYTHFDRHYFNLYPSRTSILEDDEGISGEDKLGEIELSLAGCNAEVFDQGLTSGWATTRRARLVNNYSIDYVEFKTWCYKCPNSNSDCQYRVQYGECNGTAGQWNGCRGDGCSVCDELVAGYPRYFENHPKCFRNTICGGQYYQCNSNCPAPTEADR